MSVVAAILAAGTGTRFGSDKTRIELAGKPLWRWSYDVFLSHPEVDRVILVGSKGNFEDLSLVGEAFVGGATRQESSRIAIEAAPEASLVLVHDAARPFVTADTISAVIAAAKRSGAAAPALAVTDTIKSISPEFRTLDRATLFAVQTPQAIERSLLDRAHNQAGDFVPTDDLSLVERLGIVPELVQGDPNNMKVTNPEDLRQAKQIAGIAQVRTGLGYDVHRFKTDSSAPCILGGVPFEEAPPLDGHSDADALLHAVTDALLGSIAQGDIGQHFPNTDPSWAGAASTLFLTHAAEMVRSHGWRIVNIDATVIAEIPKIMRKADEIRRVIAEATDLSFDQVSVKATTNEGLGTIGRREGIAAFAIATVESL